MAMTRTTLGTSGWTQITAGGDVDTLVVIEGGPARLCTGTPSESTDLGYNVADGYQIILPAGLAFHGVSTGGTSIAVVGPFGV